MHPTLILAIGAEGEAIARELLASSARPGAGSQDPLLRVLLVHPWRGGAAEQQEDDRLRHLRVHLGDEAEDLPMLGRCLEDALDDLRNLLGRGLRELLEQAAQPDLQPCIDPPLQVFIVTSMEEAVGIAWAVPLARCVRELLALSHPAQEVRLQGLWQVPEGAFPLGPRLCEVLEEVSGDRRESSPYDFVWLQSPLNGAGGRLPREDLRSSAAAFLLVHAGTDWPRRLWHPDRHFGALSGLGAFSALSLELQAESLVEQSVPPAARELGRRLAEPETEVQGEGEDARLWGESQDLSPTELENDLLHDEAGASLLGETRLFVPDPEHPDRRRPLLETDKVPMEEWPGLLSGYDAFYLREKLPVLLEQVDAAAVRRAEDLEAALAGEIDRRVESQRTPARARAFVEALSREIDTLRSALAHLPAAAPASLDTKPLREAVGGRPDAWGIALRLGLLAALLWPLGSAAAEALAPYLDASFRLAVGTPANALAAALLVGLPAAAAGILIYHRATARIASALRRALEQQEAGYRGALRARARQRALEILNDLFGRLADAESLDRQLPDYSGPSERASLERFSAVLAEAAGHVADPPPPRSGAFHVRLIDCLDPRPEIPYRRGQFDWSQEAAEIPYRRGQFDWSQEAAEFPLQGGYRGWRCLDAEGLARRLCDHARRGFDYVLRLRLCDWMQDNLSETHLEELWRRIGPLCDPYLLHDVTLEPAAPVQRLALLCPPAQEEFTRWLTQPAPGDWETCSQGTDPGSLLLITVREEAGCRHLRAWPIWQASEAEGD